jgi:Fe-S-cluster formation regulator IscX/YfhJ
LDGSSDRRLEFAADTTAKRLEARDGDALDKGFPDFQDRVDDPSHYRVLALDRWRRSQPAFEDAPARSAHPLLGAVQQFDVIGVRDDLATGTAA